MKLRYKRMYNEAMDAIIARLIMFSSPSKLVYLSDRLGLNLHPTMHHLACFAGGMFALGAYPL